MAIARGNVGNWSAIGPGDPLTQAYDSGTLGSDRYLVVCIWIFTTSDLVTGVTYAGNSMTQLAKYQGIAQGGTYQYFYGIAAPTTGSNDIVIDGSSTLPLNTWVGAVTYTGVKQTAQPDSTANTNRTSPTSGDFTVTTTTVADNSWILMMESDNNGNMAATANSTKITTWSAGFGTQIFDSNGPKTPAGSNTITVNGANGGSQDGFVVSLAPAVSVAVSSVAPTLLLMGVG
jgi:hypothetical protein